MASNTTVKRYGLSDDPTFDHMMYELGQLAGKWDETKEKTYLERYRILFCALLDMGWDEELDLELMLPFELMPPEYFARYEEE